MASGAVSCSRDWQGTVQPPPAIGLHTQACKLLHTRTGEARVWLEAIGRCNQNTALRIGPGAEGDEDGRLFSCLARGMYRTLPVYLNKEIIPLSSGTAIQTRSMAYTCFSCTSKLLYKYCKLQPPLLILLLACTTYCLLDSQSHGWP